MLKKVIPLFAAALFVAPALAATRSPAAPAHSPHMMGTAARSEATSGQDVKQKKHKRSNKKKHRAHQSPPAR